MKRVNFVVDDYLYTLMKNFADINRLMLSELIRNILRYFFYDVLTIPKQETQITKDELEERLVEALLKYDKIFRLNIDHIKIKNNTEQEQK